MDELLAISDRVKQGLGDGAAVVLGAAADGKAMLVANLAPGAVEAGLSAGAVIREVAPIVGGGGGGKEAMARAGGKDPAQAPGGARRRPASSCGGAGGVKVLALDHGPARTGVAVSDPTGTIARPLPAIAAGRLARRPPGAGRPDRAGAARGDRGGRAAVAVGGAGRAGAGGGGVRGPAAGAGGGAGGAVGRAADHRRGVRGDREGRDRGPTSTASRPASFSRPTWRVARDGRLAPPPASSGRSYRRHGRGAAAGGGARCCGCS